MNIPYVTEKIQEAHKAVQQSGLTPEGATAAAGVVSALALCSIASSLEDIADNFQDPVGDRESEDEYEDEDN